MTISAIRCRDIVTTAGKPCRSHRPVPATIRYRLACLAVVDGAVTGSGASSFEIVVDGPAPTHIAVREREVVLPKDLQPWA